MRETKLPDVLWKEIASLLTDADILKSTSKKFNVIDSEKIFDKNLISYLRDNKQNINMVYIDDIIAFWYAGMYLDVVPELLTDVFDTGVRTFYYYDILDKIIKCLKTIGYNNWYSTNPKGLQNFINQLYTTTKRWEVYKLILDIPTTLTKLKEEIDKQINFINAGEIALDMTYFKILPDLIFNGKQELSEYIENKLLTLTPIVMTPKWKKEDEKDCVLITQDELKYFIGKLYNDESTCETDKNVVDEKLAQIAYQNLFVSSIKKLNFNLAKKLMKYKFKKYNLKFPSDVIWLTKYHANFLEDQYFKLLNAGVSNDELLHTVIYGKLKNRFGCIHKIFR